MGNTLPYSFVFLAVVLTARALAGGPAVPIQSIFLSVFRPALLHRLESHLWDNTEAAKRNHVPGTAAIRTSIVWAFEPR
jgi:hypothetical protein